MAGLDRERLIRTLGVTDGFKPEAGFAIGRPGDPEMLPEALRLRGKLSDRLPLAEIAFEGSCAPKQ